MRNIHAASKVSGKSGALDKANAAKGASTAPSVMITNLSTSNEPAVAILGFQGGTNKFGNWGAGWSTGACAGPPAGTCAHAGMQGQTTNRDVYASSATAGAAGSNLTASATISSNNWMILAMAFLPPPTATPTPTPT